VGWLKLLVYKYHPARLPPLNSSFQPAALSLWCGSGLAHGWLRREVILMAMLPNGAC